VLLVSQTSLSSFSFPLSEKNLLFADFERLLKFVNRDGSMEQTLECLKENQDGTPKPKLPLASQQFGQGKTYLGQFFQWKLKEALKSDTLPDFLKGFGRELLEKVANAHYVLLDFSELGTIFFVVFILYSLIYISPNTFPW
jgi:hypothetical protein